MNDEDNVTGGDLAKSITFEVAANSLLDKYSGLLLAAPDPTQASKILYALANVGGSAAINYFAQRIRGGKFNLGELLTAGGLSLIPGGVQAKTLKGRVAKGATKGAGLGALQVTGESLINEKELPKFEEALLGAGFGGTLGGALSGVSGPEASKFVKALKNRIKRKKLVVQEIKEQVAQQKPQKNLGGYMDDEGIDIEDYGFGPEGPRGGATDEQIMQAYRERTGELDLDPRRRAEAGNIITGQGTNQNQGLNFAQQTPPPIDPKDVPRNEIGTWRTAGQKSQPLNFLFGRDAGWRKGRLNLKSWREHPKKGDKNIAEQFLTPQDKGVPFSSERDKKNLFMSRVFGIEGAEQLLNLPPGTKRIFQAHHNTATKAVLTGQEGLVYDSPYYHEIQKVWEDLNLTLGNNPENIIGTLGLVQRDLNSPHSLIHKFLDSKMGPDGTQFWTEEIMNQIVIYDNAGNAIGHKNFPLRLQLTKEQALIFKEAVDLLKLAHRQFYLAKGVKPGKYLTTEPIFDEEIVDSFINKLPPKGGTGEYTTDIISKIAREVAEETDIKPTIPSFSFKQLIEEVADKNVREQLDDMYRFAVNQANGEDMLIEVIFNNMKPKDAIKKYRGNDPAAAALAKELSNAVKYNRQRLKQLYQTKFGELPSAVTKFDKGADD